MIRRISFVALLLLLVLGERAPVRAEQATPAASAAADPWPFPGLYLDRAMSATWTDTSATIVSTESCSQVTSVLSSGEWTRSAKVRGFSLTGAEPRFTWLTLLSGVNMALATVASIGNGCLAQVIPIKRATVAATGTTDISGKGYAIPLICDAGDDGAGYSLGLALQGPGKYRALVFLDIPDGDGARPLDVASGDSVAYVGASSKSVLSLASALIQAQIESMSDAAPADLALQPLIPGAGATGTATVKMRHGLLSGNVTIDGMRDIAGNPASVSFSFSCELRAA